MTIAASVPVEGLGAVGVLPPFDTIVLQELVTLVEALGVLLATVVVPAGVYREREGGGPGQWRPSTAYYLAAVPFVGAIFALIYPIQRAQK